MPIEVVMPKFGLTMTEGTIQQWFKSEGAAVKAGEPLFEVETEKVLYEVEAPSDGTVARLLYAAESVVGVGLPVAIIAESGEDVTEIAGRYVQDTPASGASIAAPDPVEQPDNVKTTSPAQNQGRVPITPAARKLAKTQGIDLSQITGTGPRGRITREDVQKIIDSGGTTNSQDLGDSSSKTQVTEFKGMRKVIAERMHRSLQTTAQLTISTEVDVSELVARRREVKEQIAVTYTDFIIQACAHALKTHARMNASLEGKAIQQHSDINVGLAVALEEGLIVPVLRNVDQKPLKTLAEEAKILADKARNNQLKLEEVSGGTFTVSNLGMYGIDAFTPILNAPQTGILGVGRIVRKPAVYKDVITPRSMMVLSLTFDHRVIDGAPAGAFLETVGETLAQGNRVSL